MSYLATIDPIAHVSSSADEKIRPILDRLNEKAGKNVQSLTPTEWCLRRILEIVHDGLKIGPTQIDLQELGDYMVDEYGDEGTEVWLAAFDDATKIAIQLFTPHPDSQ